MDTMTGDSGQQQQSGTDSLSSGIQRGPALPAPDPPNLASLLLSPPSTAGSGVQFPAQPEPPPPVFVPGPPIDYAAWDSGQPQATPAPCFVGSGPIGSSGENRIYDINGQQYYNGHPIATISQIGDGKGLLDSDSRNEFR
jgi:hypothetical protein